MTVPRLGLGCCVVGWLLCTAARAEGQAEPVRVEIAGVSGDEARNVKTVLAVARAAESGKLAPERLRQLHRQADADIRLALEPFGFFRPTVQKSLQEIGGAWVARYTIDPGPAVLVRTVDLRLTGEGAETEAFRKKAADFPLHPGDTLRTLPYETAKLGLLTLATDSGYLDAKFDSSAVLVDRRASTADLVVHFDTGPRFRFGPVTFEQDALAPTLLERRVPFKPGDPYRGDKLLAMQTAIAEDQYFRQIDVIPRRDQASGLEVPIEVKLSPRKPREFQFGGETTRLRVRLIYRRFWQEVAQSKAWPDNEIVVVDRVVTRAKP